VISALIAHYDPLGERSANFSRLLQSIKPLSEHSIVVSTGITASDASSVTKFGFALIRRENVGYDFMSYAVGFDSALTAILPEQILFCNDSIFISDMGLFANCLQRLLDDECNAAFLLTSRQGEEHGQSFCFKFRRRLYVRPQVREFFASVRPLPNRLDVVFRYEIGLSHRIKDMGEKLVGVLNPLCLPGIRAANINSTHIYAAEIEAHCGFIKYERLMVNPLGLENSSRLLALSNEAHSEASASPVVSKKRICPAVIICHCHYVEVVDDLINALEHLPDRAEIHITSANAAVMEMFKIRWLRRHIKLHVHAVENRGRDMLPFFDLLRKLDVPDDTPILKIHGKRSLYSPLGTKWRRDLFAGLLPSAAATTQALDAFRRNPRLGMLGPSGSYTSNLDYWGGNRKQVADLINRAVDKEIVNEDLGFFAGSMFWIRALCARKLLPLVSSENFESEANQRDGTFAHALERAVPMIVRLSGWELREEGTERSIQLSDVRQRVLAYF
jgi:lipopolysaccharide biosynthesis protein